MQLNKNSLTWNPNLVLSLDDSGQVTHNVNLSADRIKYEINYPKGTVDANGRFELELVVFLERNNPVSSEIAKALDNVVGAGSAPEVTMTTLRISATGHFCNGRVVTHCISWGRHNANDLMSLISVYWRCESEDLVLSDSWYPIQSTMELMDCSAQKISSADVSEYILNVELLTTSDIAIISSDSTITYGKHYLINQRNNSINKQFLDIQQEVIETILERIAFMPGRNVSCNVTAACVASEQLVDAKFLYAGAVGKSIFSYRGDNFILNIEIIVLE